jgi:putative endonuclease
MRWLALFKTTGSIGWSFAEFHDTMEPAILREKRLKKWRRAWKLELIERHNPQWRDLYDELAV